MGRVFDAVGTKDRGRDINITNESIEERIE